MKKGMTNYGFKKSQTSWRSNARKRIQIDNVRVYEHRKIMEEYLGRKLSTKEHVHHVNGDPTDNRIENLSIVSPSEHGKIHKG